MKILLTGFEPFGEITDNPSQRIVEHFAAKGQSNLITAILPVDYAATNRILPELLENHRPDAVLMLGVAQKRDSINLERIAININDAKIADNTGTLKSGQPIIEDAPVAYRSSLPLEAMYQAIQNAGIAVTYSNHAGAYLCNHVFYLARHSLECAGLGHIPCGFIHIPDMGEEAPKMPLPKLIQAVRVALSAVMRETLSNVLKRLEQNLPEKPDWIVLSSVDGLEIGGVNIIPPSSPYYHEERSFTPILAGFVSFIERVDSELELGLPNFIVISGDSGLALLLPIHDEYILGMKFGKGTNYTTLATIGNSLPNMLEELKKTLRNP
jgi:pyroglutamyl-peptidase